MWHRPPISDGFFFVRGVPLMFILKRAVASAGHATPLHAKAED
jgi:hypothetical protein